MDEEKPGKDKVLPSFFQSSSSLSSPDTNQGNKVGKIDTDTLEQFKNIMTRTESYDKILSAEQASKEASKQALKQASKASKQTETENGGSKKKKTRRRKKKKKTKKRRSKNNTKTRSNRRKKRSKGKKRRNNRRT